MSPHTTMNPHTHETVAIGRATEYYFRGIYEGQVQLLARVFHPNALLFADVKGQPYAKTLAAYLEGVAQRISPENSGQAFETEIFHIEVINSIAVAKVRVKMYDFNYYDFLSFHKVDGEWLIVNKMFTHVEE